MRHKKLVVADSFGNERVYEPDHLEAREEGMLKGHALIEIWGEDGNLKHFDDVPNLITQVGDQLYGEWAAGITSPPARVTGMKLGTGSTAPAKVGVGAALVTYLAASQRAIDAGFPTSALTADATPKRRIQFKSTWAAGIATNGAITEVVLINDALADLTSAAAATIARILTNPGVPATGVAKGASDTLEVVWSHDLVGA